MGSQPFIIDVGDWKLEARINDDGLHIVVVSDGPPRMAEARMTVAEAQDFREYLFANLPV